MQSAVSLRKPLSNRIMTLGLIALALGLVLTLRTNLFKSQPASSAPTAQHQVAYPASGGAVGGLSVPNHDMPGEAVGQVVSVPNHDMPEESTTGSSRIPNHDMPEQP